MTDWWNKIIEKLHLPKFLDHNRWLALALVLSLGLIGGCQFFKAKVPGLKDPSVNVDQYQFEAQASEITIALESRAIQLKADTESAAAKIDMGREELFRRQDAIDKAVGAFKTMVGTYVPLAGSGVLDAVFGLIAGGALIDNRRKSRVITAMKNDAASPAM